MAVLTLARLIVAFVLINGSSRAQRLSQGASDWYMRFHEYDSFGKRNVDRPVTKSFTVSSQVVHCYAVTTVSMIVHNPATFEQTYNFGFVMPKEALVSNVSIAGSSQGDSVTAELAQSELFERNSAESEKAKEKPLPAASEGKRSGQPSFHQFVLPINLRPNEEATVTLVYEQLLQRNEDKYRHVISLSPGEIVKDFQVRLSIVDNHPLGNVSVTAPVIGPLNLNATTPEEPGLTQDDFHLTFNMSELEQNYFFGPHGFTGDLITEFSLKDKKEKFDIVLEDDVFVHSYKGPKESMQKMPSHATFMLDRSMTAAKLGLAKEALFHLLEGMTGQDYFNLVLFNEIEKEPRHWNQEQPTMIKNAENVETFKEFVQSLSPLEGNTTSNSLSEAMRLGQDLIARSDMRDVVASTIVLLTTGNVLQVSDQIDQDIPVIVVGLGYDAPIGMMEETFGSDVMVTNVVEDQLVADQLAGVQKHLHNVLLKNVDLRYFSDTEEEIPMTKNKFAHLRRGSALVLAGQLAEGETLTAVEITAQSSGGLYKKRMPFVQRPHHLGCEAEITLCSRTGLRGKCITLNESNNKLASLKFAKRATSAKIGGTCAWTIFARSNFRKPMAVLSPGEYEVLPGLSYKTISSLRVTKPDSPSQLTDISTSKRFAQKILAYLTIQDTLNQPSSEATKAQMCYDAAVGQNFMTPYTSIRFSNESGLVDRPSLTFNDLLPKFFAVDDSEQDVQWEALMDCQKPNDCSDNFHYHIANATEDLKEDQGCDGTLSLFVRPKHEGDKLEITQSLDQIFHATNRFRIRSLHSSGNCCWLLFNHRLFAGNVERICGDAMLPSWAHNIASVKRIGQQPPPVA